MIIRKPLPAVGEILLGTGLVDIGLGIFIEGLERALFPMGEGEGVFPDPKRQFVLALHLQLCPRLFDHSSRTSANNRLQPGGEHRHRWRVA